MARPAAWVSWNPSWQLWRMEQRGLPVLSPLISSLGPGLSDPGPERLSWASHPPSLVPSPSTCSSWHKQRVSEENMGRECPCLVSAQKQWAEPAVWPEARVPSATSVLRPPASQHRDMGSFPADGVRTGRGSASRQGPLPQNPLPARGLRPHWGLRGGTCPRQRPACPQVGYRGRRRSWGNGQRTSSLRTEVVLNPGLLASSPFSPMFSALVFVTGTTGSPGAGGSWGERAESAPSSRTSLTAPGFSSASAYWAPKHTLPLRTSLCAT